MTLKLLPEDADTYEVRVRGPNVTPGFFRRPDLAATAFDGEGFYCPGDAVSFADPNDPAAGLVFRGRLAEDFKLSTGTFVRVGALRTALLSAVPVLADAVLTGEDRDEVGALVWLNRSELPDSLTELDTSTEVIDSAALAAHLAPMLSALNAGTGSALSIARLLVLGRPPSLDAGEITDKGYLNQRQVLAHRRHLVELLYAQPAAPEVIRPAAAGMASPAR